jgi:hypothetical protein
MKAYYLLGAILLLHSAVFAQNSQPWEPLKYPIVFKNNGQEPARYELIFTNSDIGNKGDHYKTRCIAPGGQETLTEPMNAYKDLDPRANWGKNVAFRIGSYKCEETNFTCNGANKTCIDAGQFIYNPYVPQAAGGYVIICKGREHYSCRFK